MIIDSHLHVWVQKPDQYPWQPIGGYIPENEAPVEKYLEVMDAEGVDRAVLVQPTPYGWDNSYLLDSSAAHPDRFRTVCLVDPLSEGAAGELADLVAEGANGVRINWHLQPVEVWEENLHHQALWRCAQELDIPICLQLTPEYIPLVRKMAINYSGVKVVMDHLGRPKSGCLPEDSTFRSLLKLSQFPNLYIKLSGMNYYSQEAAPYRDTWLLLQAVHANFGSQRCMWGSDFPFVMEHWTYSDLLHTLKTQLNFSTDALNWILGKTARLLWWKEE